MGSLHGDRSVARDGVLVIASPGVHISHCDLDTRKGHGAPAHKKGRDVCGDAQRREVRGVADLCQGRETYAVDGRRILPDVDLLHLDRWLGEKQVRARGRGEASVDRVRRTTYLPDRSLKLREPHRLAIFDSEQPRICKCERKNFLRHSCGKG